jgi:hypothetical protein
MPRDLSHAPAEQTTSEARSDEQYHWHLYVSSNSTKSPASGTATVSQPRLMSQVGRVRVDQCVSAVEVVEMPVFLRALSSSNDTSVASTRVRSGQVTPGIPDDPFCLSPVAAANGWVKVDTWPLIHGGCYHMIEVDDRMLWETSA